MREEVTQVRGQCDALTADKGRLQGTHKVSVKKSTRTEAMLQAAQQSVAQMKGQLRVVTAERERERRAAGREGGGVAQACRCRGGDGGAESACRLRGW